MTALSRYQDEGLERLKVGLASGGTVRESFQAIFDGAVKECASKDRARGCLCVNTAVELGPRDPEIAAMLLLQARRVTALFAETLERGKVQGELDARLDTLVTARFLLVTLFGIHVGGKTGFAAKKLDEVVAVAMSVLSR
jgi:TetR/AcrR family transcriptional repressor of nem operon